MRRMRLLERILVTSLLVSVISACGTTDPSPVGIDLVDLVGGDVVEVLEIPATEARSQFREIFPSVLGRAEELLVGRMNGVNYVSLYEMAFDVFDLPNESGASLQVDSLFVELKILGNLSRGNTWKTDSYAASRGLDRDAGFCRYDRLFG